MTFIPGTRSGVFEILSVIGTNGTAEVYRAINLESRQEVALKVLPASLTSDTRYMNRLQREIQNLASVNHPNIAAIYGLEENAIVAELVPGSTLEERLAHGPLRLPEALVIGKQIAAALEAAHDKGIVHHDLKPSNVKITPDGKIKVLNFLNGFNQGTPGYMSPEQAAGEPVDKSANIWSFGVIVYEMLTGGRMFTGGTAASTPGNGQQAAVDLSRLKDDTPVAIRGLIARCLDRQARYRLRNMSEARAAIEASLADPSANSQEAKPPAARSGRGRWTLGAAIAAAVVAAAFLVLRQFSSEPLRAEVISVSPVSDRMAFQDDGFAGSGVAVSPDGQRVVFQAVFKGVTALWQQELGQPIPRVIPGTEGGAGPFWSPDGRNIGFSASGKLRRIPLGGGESTPICAVGYSTGGSWNKDDVIIFGSNDGGVFRVAASGGTPIPVTELNKSRGEDSHRYPSFLPDGHHFFYTARLGERRDSSVYVGDLDSKERKRVLDFATNAVYAEPGYVLFAVGRTLMAQPFDTRELQTSGESVPIAQNVSYSSNPVVANFGASQAVALAYTSTDVGIVQLTWFDHSGKVVGAVGPPGALEFFSLAPDERALVVPRNNTATWKFDLWRYNLPENSGVRFTSTGHNRFPVWSSDGKEIAFNGSQGGATKLYQKPADGSGAEEVLEAADKIPADWSRDGRYLITMTGNQTPVTGNDIWVLPLFGDRTPFPYLNSRANEFFARLSPDGHWMAYASNETKRDEVYVAGFPEVGDKYQISSGGGSRPEWSRDGKQLYFMNPDGKVMAVEVKAGKTFHAGTPRPLFGVRFPFKNHNFDVTRDGRFLIPVLVDQSSIPLTVVRNWTVLLKKQ